MTVAIAATRHSSINRAIMLDWIKVCIDEGKPLPTDEEIAARFQFLGIEQSRTLLADLADQGLIRIRHGSDGREISLGEAPASKASAARPIPSVVKPSRRPKTVDECAAKIVSILRPKRAGQPKNPVAHEARPAQPEIAGELEAPVSLTVSPVPLAQPGPQPAKAKRQTRDQRRNSTRMQLNIRPSDRAIDHLRGMQLPGEVLSATLARLLEQVASGQQVADARKPLVSGKVLKAANQARKDLHVFAGELIELGFERWIKRQGRASR